jgi:hypothetical protein
LLKITTFVFERFTLKHQFEQYVCSKSILSCIQTSNLQKLDWYISTKHIYVSDEYNIWKDRHM